MATPRGTHIGRGSAVIVNAFGQALFRPGTDVSNWNRRLSNIVTAQTRLAAPSHDYAKRPLRPHPWLKTLKETITSTSRTEITEGGGIFWTAVGSSAPYAAFVDQGTNGQAAKILPPWSPGSPTLYDSAWVNPATGRPVGPKLVPGQRAREYFAAGLQRGFETMGLRSIEAPGSGETLTSFPETLAAEVTTSDQPYAPSIAEWRRWREDAFWARMDAERALRGSNRKSERQKRANKILVGGLEKARVERRASETEAVRRVREARAKGREAKKKFDAERAAKGREARAKEKSVAHQKADALKRLRAQYPLAGIRSTPHFVVVTINGVPTRYTWSQLGVR